MSKKYCYLFTEGNANMRELLGGKGANLAEMTNIGLPVPQGFTITTEACTQYYEDGQKINDGIVAEIMEYIEKMEEVTGKKFGDAENPLLVSVRSGARASMPGMMDTILNLGLNGVHHTRHRCPGAGTNGDQQGVLLVTELLAGDLLQLGNVGHDLSLDIGIDLTAIFVVLGAGFGGDGEALRHGQTNVGHFGQVSALTAQQLTHGAVAFGKQINILVRHLKFSPFVILGVPFSPIILLFCMISKFARIV